MLSPVCLSHGEISQKTVEGRIMKFSPYGSHIPLVFAGYVSSRNSNGFPQAGASNNRGFAYVLLIDIKIDDLG